MPVYTLALHSDRLGPKAEARLPACHRVLYVRNGDVRVSAGGAGSGLAADSAWYGDSAVAVMAGNAGATLLRWELTDADSTRELAGTGVVSSRALGQTIELAGGGHVMRCDRVDFPPGGIAYTHVHRGPGIRCLLKGTIRVEVNGGRHDVAPGGAWFEAGPDPVLALASQTESTAFVRVMVLPGELKGKSSIRYVNPEDADKPKLQTYRVYVDERIELG